MLDNFLSFESPNGMIAPKYRVEFVCYAVQDEEKTKSAGRPIFRDEEHFIFYKPGGEVFQRKATKEDRINYPTEYAKFKEEHSQIIEGTPIALWADSIITPAVVQELAAIGIRTIEQLASCEDLEEDVEAQKLITAAKKYLAGADATKELQKLRNENHELKLTNSDLKKQLDAAKQLLKQSKKKEE